MCHIINDQSRPKVTMATQNSGEPKDGWSKTPPLKLPRLHWQLKSPDFNMEQYAHVKHNEVDDLEPKDTEPKGERVKEGTEGQARLWGSVQGAHPGCPGGNTCIRPSICCSACREDVLGGSWASLEGSGCVLSVGGTGKYRHVGDLFSFETPL